MPNIHRRKFLGRSSVAALACAADLSFLLPLARSAASKTKINPNDIEFGSETERLLRLIRDTSREQCVPAFVQEIKQGLSYQEFLKALFFAAIENGDPHQVAQVYGAHRISSDVRVEERLLPLFWALNRVKQEHEKGKMNPALKLYKGTLPGHVQAEQVFRQGLIQSDPEAVEGAAITLARDLGARHVLQALWEFASRNVGGTLGHPAIALANGIRTLDVMGYQHAEVGLRYVAGYVAHQKQDNTYATNLERTKKTAALLAPGWAGSEGANAATLELYNLLRAGDANTSCDLICAQLVSGKVRAGAIWDAVSLAAADTVYRYRTGGGSIGGSQIHAITTANALRFGFDQVSHSQTKLLLLLQAAGVTADFFVKYPKKEGNLREMNLLGLKAAPVEQPAGLREVFELLPYKSNGYNQKRTEERAASDQACQMAFRLLGDVQAQGDFMQMARSFLCVKASLDPHDIKYPAAAFEDVSLVSPEWRPYLLASSVHALHGTSSSDTPVLLQVREALKRS